MILNVLTVHVRRLIHNRVELLLTFIVPVAFFSVFAVIFAGGVGGGTTPKIKVALVDRSESAFGATLIRSLQNDDSLRIMRDEPPASISTDQAAAWVRSGSITMAIVVQNDRRRTGAAALAVELLADSSDQVATQVVSAVVSQTLGQLSSRQASPPVAGRPARESSPEAEPGFAAESSFAAAGDPQGTSNFDRSPAPRLAINRTADLPPGLLAPRRGQPVATDDRFDAASMVRVVDVLGENKSNPVISMYAAGIAVMFLLFGASGGGGTLLEEKENQTLDRLLSTQMTMDQLILGKWVYLTLLGVVQVTVMFAWAQCAFGVDMLGHFDGFLMMTIVTSAAAASLGLFLATLCKSRGQLNGLSVILILTMSALGGSMVPRYIMSDSLRDAGLWTFNAWALDGYDKIFWRELPVESLAPQMGVLMLSGVALLVAARLLAVRWETQ